MVASESIPAASSQATTAQAVVNKYVPWSMGVGIIPAPVVVIAGLFGIQLKMVSDLCKIYGVPFSEQRTRSILGALVGGIAPAAIGYGGLSGLVAAIPLVGPWLLPVTLPILSGAATYAVGKTFIQHFESGGTFLNFDNSEAKELFAKRYEEGKAEARKFASKISSAVPRPAAAS